ncbi:hypothetical protein HY495_02265 [Candidatus Woesearchaeota archaeon]|nr:hypothetical protein [Candidatus Woesearchaeota archaeon]
MTLDCDRETSGKGESPLEWIATTQVAVAEKAITFTVVGKGPIPRVGSASGPQGYALILHNEAERDARMLPVSEEEYQTAQIGTERKMVVYSAGGQYCFFDRKVAERFSRHYGRASQ